MRLCALNNKEIYIRKQGFPQKNKDLFNYEKNKEVYIENKIIYMLISKK